MNKTLIALVVSVATAAGGAAGYVAVKRAIAPVPKNKTVAFVMAVEPGSECEESALLSRAVEHQLGEKRDVSLCLDNNFMFKCVAGAKLGDKPDCSPVGEFQSADEKKAAEEKAKAAAVKKMAEDKVKAEAQGSAGSGSAK